MKRRRALLLTLTVIFALCAACGWWLHREQQQYAHNRQLIAALERGDSKAALGLVNEGADPNTRQSPPAAPSFKLLLDQLLHRVPPASTSPTALLLACGQPALFFHRPAKVLPENLPLLRAMLAHGANVHATAFGNLTALHSAVGGGRLQTVALLLQHGADPNVQDISGQSPLIFAVRLGQVDIERALLSHGANPNLTDSSTSSALHNALFIERNGVTIITDLLAHGDDPNLRDSQGDTPLQSAKKIGNKNAVRLLKQHGGK